MSDIFLSYKREEDHIARNLADTLEREGWSVWWDPMLWAVERFNDVIEKESQYKKDEATYALNRNKLAPVMIEEARRAVSQTTCEN